MKHVALIAFTGWGLQPGVVRDCVAESPPGTLVRAAARDERGRPRIEQPGGVAE
jgi:hypothetical protein